MKESVLREFYTQLRMAFLVKLISCPITYATCSLGGLTHNYLLEGYFWRVLCPLMYSTCDLGGLMPGYVWERRFLLPKTHCTVSLGGFTLDYLH